MLGLVYQVTGSNIIWGKSRFFCEDSQLSRFWSRSGLFDSSPPGPPSCMSQMFLCHNTPDSNERITISLTSKSKAGVCQWPSHLNQVCWSRETSQTCRTAALEDWSRRPPDSGVFNKSNWTSRFLKRLNVSSEELPQVLAMGHSTHLTTSNIHLMRSPRRLTSYQILYLTPWEQLSRHVCSLCLLSELKN